MDPSVCPLHLLLFHLLLFPHLTTYSPPFYLASFSLNICHSPSRPFILYSLVPPCNPPSVLYHLFWLNLTISYPPLLGSQAKYYKPPPTTHLLSVRNKGEGHARRSWHQPVTPPFPLPPSVSLLNQITPLTHAHTSPFLNQFLSLFSSCPFIFCSPKPYALCSLYLPASDRLCKKKNTYSRNPIGKKIIVYLHAFFFLVFVCLDDFA